MQSYETIIIGGGVSGLAQANILSLLKKDFIVLEQNNKIGGIWYTTVYPGLGSHTPNEQYRFLTQPWKENQIAKDRDNYLDLYPNQPSGKDVLNYLENYAKPFYDKILLGIQVKKIIYHTQKKKFEIIAINGDDHEVRFYCYHVIATLGNKFNAGKIRLPKILENDNTCDIVHASKLIDLKKYKNKKIILVGTGKSAQDLLIIMSKLGFQKNVTVLYANSLWSVYYDALISAQHSIKLKVAFLIKAIFGWNFLTQTIINYLIKDYMVNIFDNTEDPDNWNIAVVKKEHINLLRSFKSQKILKCSEHKIQINHLLIGDRTFPADLVIYATGYEQISNETFIKVQKANGDNIEDVTISYLYNATMCVDIPNLFIPCGRTGLSSAMQSELDAIWISTRLFGNIKKEPLDPKHITPFPFNFDPRSMIGKKKIYRKLLKKFLNDIDYGGLFEVNLTLKGSPYEQVIAQKHSSLVKLKHH